MRVAGRLRCLGSAFIASNQLVGGREPGIFMLIGTACALARRVVHSRSEAGAQMPRSAAAVGSALNSNTSLCTLCALWLKLQKKERPTVYSHFSEKRALTRHLMPPLTEDFYPALVRKIIPACGSEYIDRRPAEFHTTIDTLNRELRLGLDSLDCQVFGLLLTGLAGARRFGGDVFIRAEAGENSAVHSCHTAILMNEVFRRAGLLSTDTQTREVVWKRVDMTLGCLVHDMGEMLGEFSTLAERTDDSSIHEDADLERPVFKFSLELAYQSAAGNEPGRFYSVLSEMRNELEAFRAAGRISVRQVLQVLQRHEVGDISFELADRIGGLLYLYDLAELKSGISGSAGALPYHQSPFLGYAVKAVEHVQGTRHLIRFATKAPSYKRISLFSPQSTAHAGHEQRTNFDSEGMTLPISLSPSSRVVGNIKYLEGEVGYVMAHAESPAEKALAGAIRTMVYQTVVEELNAKSPVIDRKAGEPDKRVRQLILELKTGTLSSEMKREKLRSLKDRLEDSITAIDQARTKEQSRVQDPKLSTRTLFRYETNCRVIGLYLAAIKKEYVPKPGELLMLQDSVPEELRPLKAANLKQLQSGMEKQSQRR